ncbi:MAG: phosphotransferase [Leucobacter sp.]
MFDDSAQVLQATAESLGVRLIEHRFLHEHVNGDGFTQAYETKLEAPDGSVITQIVYLETSPIRNTREDVLVFRDDESGDEVSVWLYPRDPALPALPTAVYPKAAGVILQKMGVDLSSIALDLVAYRPGKRAVVRAQTDNGTVYIKVVRPVTITHLHALYQDWSDEGLPVPKTLGWTEDGLLGFEALPGVPALDVIERLDDTFFDSVIELVQRYNQTESMSPARTSLAERRDWYVRRVVARHPLLAERIHALSRKIDSALLNSARLDSHEELNSTIKDSRSLTIHGDLHLGQVFVDPTDPRQVTGVLDIDTAGAGDPADDAAAMLAHLLVSAEFLGQTDRTVGTHYERAAASWQSRWSSLSPAEDMSFTQRAMAITATHLLAHALSGPVPTEQLLDRAENLLRQDEKFLM